MVPSPPFVAITSFSRRSHWLSCYAHGGFSVSVDVEEWRGVPHGDKKRGNRRFLDGRRCCLFCYYLKTGWQMRVNRCVAASRASQFREKAVYK